MTDSRFPDEIQRATYPQFTNLALNEGLVDQLMTTVNHHLDKQYQKGRIAGADFAQVYVGSLSAVMQYSTQYLLGNLLIDEQKAKASAEIELIEAQVKSAESQVSLTEMQVEKLRYEIENILPLQVQQMELTNEKLREEISLLTAQISLTGKQEDKIDQEILFMQAKVTTEQANTVAGVAEAESLIGLQKRLLSAQRLGFAGDIHIKHAQVLANFASVTQGVLEIPENIDLGAADPTAITALSSASSTAASIGSL